MARPVRSLGRGSSRLTSDTGDRDVTVGAGSSDGEPLEAAGALWVRDADGAPAVAGDGDGETAAGDGSGCGTGEVEPGVGDGAGRALVGEGAGAELVGRGEGDAGAVLPPSTVTAPTMTPAWMRQKYS